VQRVARGLTRQLLAEAEPGAVEVLGGPGDLGGPARVGARTRLGRTLWEQTALPLSAGAARAIVNLGNLAPLASARNLVLTYDLHALRLRRHYRRGLGSLYWALAERAYRGARYRVTLTRTIAEDLEATLGGHVDAVVPPGVDDSFRPATASRVESVSRRLGIHGPYLVVVGWTQPAKRAPLAVAAHRRQARDLPHQLVLAGATRADFPEVELGPRPPSLLVTGRLSDDDLAALYTGSAGLLFCTEYEGFGLPPVEALACGTRVAVSRIPVLEEVLGGLPGVRFVEEPDEEAWADAAGQLLQEASSADAASAANRSEAARSRFRWSGKGRALLQVLDA
jgi:glycosyltransferase involved in cell wall biosynthesis